MMMMLAHARTIGARNSVQIAVTHPIRTPNRRRLSYDFPLVARQNGKAQPECESGGAGQLKTI